MSRKIEPKLLKNYLFCGLKMLHEKGTIHELTVANFSYRLHDSKPILRQRSKLTKEIKDNLFIEFGGGFQTKEHFKQHFINNIKYSAVDSLRYSTVVFLFKHHIDLFSLIENDLAIDVNSI